MNKRRVAILTFFNRMNYGADLQAYALHKKVKELGYECEILDVLSPRDPDAKKPEVYKPLTSSKKMHSVKSKINKNICRCLTAIFGSKNNQSKMRRFEAFKRDYLTVSRRKFASVDDLYHGEMPYDIFITSTHLLY